MALPQDRYVDITTGEGTVTVASRNLQTLVFTDSAAATGTVFDKQNDVRCTGIDDVDRAFGSASKEHDWAVGYFGYSDPNGNGSSTLIFAKCDTPGGVGAETPKDAFSRVVARTNNFGVFTFLVSMSAANVKLVADANKTMNYRFQFVAPMDLDTLNGNDYKTQADPLKAYYTACVSANGTKGTHLEFQKKILLSVDAFSSSETYEVGDKVKKDGIVYVCVNAVTTAGEWDSDDWEVSSYDVPKTFILATILSAIDWTMQDGTVSPMFRTVTGVDYDVSSASSIATDSGTGGSHSWVYTEVGADDLDRMNVSYYGNVMINGLERSFYQKGMNTDGESSIVYMGEVWLKSNISTKIINLMLSLPKIKANSEGNAQVYATVDTACTDGVTNGVIEVGKTLDSAARMAIYSQTRDAKAADIIETNGYWLSTAIVTDDDGKNYKAKYLLLYSKGDVVVKVEGSDVLY